MDETKITSDAKVMTNELYHKSISEDPSTSCQNIMQLVNHLKGLMSRCDNHDYDILLNLASRKASEAWFQYSEMHNIGRAVHIKSQVIGRIDMLVKDPRFSTYKMPAFTGRQQ